MRIILCILFFTPYLLPAQQDTMKTYTSLESALKNPEQVYRLKLQKQELKDFPKEIFLMKNLRQLDLSKNKIKVIPEEIGQLGHS